MTKIVVSNVIRYITHFRQYNQITFGLLLDYFWQLVYHIDLNEIIFYHNDVKNAKKNKICFIHCNLQHEVHYITSRFIKIGFLKDL